MALTDIQVKNAKPKGKAYKLSDAGGLFLMVTPTGGKLWRLAYRFDGKQKTLSFGAYPTITLLEARSKQDKAKKILANDQDPSELSKLDKAKKQADKANTFELWANLWLAHWRVDKSPRHVDIISRRLATNVLPVLGAMPILDITAVNIASLMRGIARRGALDVATSAHQTVSQVFRYAIANDTTARVTRNPATDIKPSDIIQSRPVVNQARVDIKDLPLLLRAIDTSDAIAITRIAMKLMALTFVRTSELIGAEWSEFDLEAKQWRISAERMKMKTPHIVPLATQAVELLTTLKAQTGWSKFLFPHRNDPKKTMSNNTILQALKRMGYQGKMTGHGFRGIASTALHEQGYAHEHIELQLAHAPRNAVSAAYNHALYLQPRTVMMQQWADYLDELKAGAKVMPFKQA
jgi:integrase